MTTSPWRTTGEAEHATLGLIGPSLTPDLVMATHFVDGTVVVTTQADGPVEVWGSVPDEGLDPAALAELGDRHTARRSGRVFHFPGVDELVGRMTVGELVARSAVDDVVMLGHREPLDADAVVDTQGFVRPCFADGRVVLDVRPAADGLAVPFEQPHPTPCCADH